VPQGEDLQPTVVFQQDGAPPHCEKVPRWKVSRSFYWMWWADYLATTVPTYYSSWFFLWSYIKYKVFSTPIGNLQTLCNRITNAIASVTEDMLWNVWQEIHHVQSCLLGYTAV
jgi:hypothetical protein